MPKERISGPSGTAVSLSEAKAHLSVDFAQDDALITSLVEAATLAVENYLLAPVRSEVWRHWFSSFAGKLVLYDQRIRSIDAVKYYDSGGVLRTLDEASYIKDLVPWVKSVTLKSSTSQPDLSTDYTYPVYIDVTTGFSAVPENIKVAIKSLVGTMYANRESDVLSEGVVTASMNRTFEFLLKPYQAKYL